MFLYRIFLYSLVFIGSLFTMCPLLGSEAESFDAMMAVVSSLSRKCFNVHIHNQNQDSITIQENLAAQLQKLIELYQSTRPIIPPAHTLTDFKQNCNAHPDKIELLRQAIKNHTWSTTLWEQLNFLFKDNLIFYTPFVYEQGVACNLLEYALYHGYYEAFRLFWKKTHNKGPIAKKFLVGILQDPGKNTFIEILKESNEGQIKLSSLLRYTLKRSLYEEAWMLLSSKVNPNALGFKGEADDGFIIDAMADKNDSVALQLLLDAGAINIFQNRSPGGLEGLSLAARKILKLNHTVAEEDSSTFDPIRFTAYVHKIKMEAFRLLRGYTRGTTIDIIENQQLGLDNSFIKPIGISDAEKALIAKHEQARTAYEERVHALQDPSTNFSEEEKNELLVWLRELDAAKEAANQISTRMLSGTRRLSPLDKVRGQLRRFLQELRGKNKKFIDGQTLLEYAVASQEYELAKMLADDENEDPGKTLFLMAGSPTNNISTMIIDNFELTNEVFYHPSWSNVRTPLEMALEQQLHNLSVTFVENIRCLIERGAVLTPEKHKEYFIRIKKLGLNYGAIKNSLMLKHILKTVPSLLNKNFE